MDAEEDQAFRRILEEQAALRERLAELDRDIAALSVSRQSSRPAPVESDSHSEKAAPLAGAPPEKESPTPPPLPPQAPEPQPAAEPMPAAHAAPRETPGGKPGAAGGFEFQLGTFWLVRIGVVMLLTGLVFLARHFLTSDQVGAGLKVAALYLASFGLLGAGAWIEKTRESMRNYGQVLGAGGLAAVYFTTFAAHKVPALAIISNNFVAGLLLLLWAGFMVFLADRKRSQTLAVMGVLLAYYTLLIDEVSLFSLWSALILSGVALAFLVRNRWTVVGSLSLAGTYLAFAYWRFPELLSWLNNAPAAPDRFWPEYGFLMCYWAVFTAAAFLSDHLERSQRAALAGLNNAAFIVFFGLGMGRYYPDQFWIFSLVAGLVFLALSEVADRRYGRRSLLATLFLAKGIVLVTLAFFIKLSGFSLAILIAAEATVLLLISTARRSPIFEAGAYLSALLAVAYTVSCEFGGARSEWFVEFTDGVPALAAFAQLFFFVFGAWWVRNRAGDIPAEARYEPRACLFIALGVLAAITGAWNDFTESSRALIFLGTGVAAAALGSWRRLRLAELAVIGQAFAAAGAADFLFQLADDRAPSLPVAALTLALLLGLQHWSRDPRSPVPAMGARPLFEWGFAIAWTVALPLVIERHFAPDAAWLYLPGLLALLQLGYSFRMRLPALAFLSQAYHPIALLEIDSSKAWYLGILPLLLLLTNIIVTDILRRRLDTDALSELANRFVEAGLLLLRVLALFFFAVFVFDHIEAPWRPLSFALAALAMHALAVRFNDGQRFAFALVLLAVTVLMILVRAADKDSVEAWQYYLAALAPFAMQQLARRFGGPASEWPVMHWVLASTGVGLTWLALSVDVASIGEGFYLTASWSLLGLVLFGAGWFLRERLYRILSLAVLGAALLRLLAVEVWDLDPIARIVTFILIGLVLLALGFMYTRYQEKLRSIF